MRKALLTAALVLMATVAQAQQTTTTTIGWFYLNTTIAQLGAQTIALSVDGATVTTAPTCVQMPAPRAADVQCSATVPNLAPGAHTVSVVNSYNGISRGSSLAGVDFSKPTPSEPTVPTVTVSVTVIVK